MRQRNIHRTACPIPRQNAIFDEMVEGGMRPIGDARNQSMFDRIDVNVIDMSSKVSIVANQVLPVTALLDATLVF